MSTLRPWNTTTRTPASRRDSPIITATVLTLLWPGASSAACASGLKRRSTQRPASSCDPPAKSSTLWADERRQDLLRDESPGVARVAFQTPPHRSRDLAHLLQEAERQAAHPVQPRRGRGAVLRLDRQPPQADRRGSLRPALLAAPADEPPLCHEPRAGAPADRRRPHDRGRAGKHQACIRPQEGREAETEMGDPQGHSAAPQGRPDHLAELPALSRIVPTDPHRLDRGREAPAGCIRAAAPRRPQDDGTEQAVRDGAVITGSPRRARYPATHLTRAPRGDSLARVP